MTTQQTKNEHTCNYCKKDPGANKKNKFHWNGFKDGDMKILVCWSCRDTHYKAKQKTEFKHLYTEFPVIMPRLIKETYKIPLDFEQ